MNKLVLIAAGAVGVAALSLVGSICTFVENRRVVKKIKKSIGEVEERSEEKIADSMIEKAVEKAAGNKIERYLEDEEDKVLKSSREELRRAAVTAVSVHSGMIRDKAAEEVARQVENLDIEDLKQRVCDRAEKSVIKKFDGALDGEVAKFREQLDSTRKLYTRMAKAAAEEDELEKRIRLVMI